MGKKAKVNKNANSRFGLVNESFIILSIIVLALVFTGCWHALHSMIKRSVGLFGEMNSKISALEFEKYMLIGKNSILLAGYNVDNMLDEGRSHQEILEYLEKEYVDLRNSVDGDYSGLYGWIDGEYMDGSDWIPPEGFDPLTRPWYTETVELDQALTYVRPYLDAKTNTIMMTISTLLKDKKSVIALDIDLTKLQEITDNIAGTVTGSISMILDNECTVVAHTDKSQLGHNYIEENDTFGSKIAYYVWGQNDLRFDLRYDMNAYDVCALKVIDGWYCVSAINTKEMYKPLLTITLSSVLAFLLSSAVFLRLYLNLSRKLEKQRQAIEALGANIQAAGALAAKLETEDEQASETQPDTDDKE